MRHYGSALGDFNDTSSAEQFSLLEKIYVNLSEPLSKKGEGSIRFNGSWEMIDLCFVTADLERKSQVQVLRIPFLMEKDASHGGLKPFRTYLGPAYHGGVSDHCPIAIAIHE